MQALNLTAPSVVRQNATHAGSLPALGETACHFRSCSTQPEKLAFISERNPRRGPQSRLSPGDNFLREVNM